MRAFLVIWLSAFPLCGATYYVDYAGGNDANNGTSTATPWKRHPNMFGWAGSHTVIAGDRFILKGGVTWLHDSMSLYITANGTEGSRIYVGVDTNWFTGASWSRPILDSQGTNSADTRNVIGGSGGTRNNPVYIKGDYVTLDSLEVKGHVISTAAASWGWGIQGNTANFIIITNCYVHDWVPTVVDGGAYGGIGFQQGGTFTSDSIVINCIIAGPTNVDAGLITVPGETDTGVGVEGAYFVTGCDISHVIQGSWNNGIVDGCLIHNGGLALDQAAHANAVNMYVQGTLKNCKIYDWGTGTIVFITPGWPPGGTVYCYNNLIWNVGAVPISTSESSNEEAFDSNAHIYNNTIYNPSGVCIYLGDRTGQPPLDFIGVNNNLMITDVENGLGIDTWVMGAPTLTTNANHTMTTAAATANGLTIANLFRPGTSIAALFNQGTNMSAFFTTDCLGVARPYGAAWDIGADEFVPAAPPAMTLGSGMTLGNGITVR